MLQRKPTVPHAARSKQANAIRAKRLALNWSQEDLALRLQVSKQRISQLETGTRPINPKMRRLLADVFEARVSGLKS